MTSSFVADTLWHGGRVLTMDRSRPVASHVVTWRGRILAVGGEELADVPVRERVDLRGRTVLPGLHDAHQHMAWFGRTLGEVDLTPSSVSDLDELYATVADVAATSEGWVIGWGYDQGPLGAHPTRAQLDRVAPGRPVWLKHTSGHMGVASSALLDLTRLREEREVDGGRVVRDADGEPTGLLEEGAMSLVQELLVPYAEETIVDALDRASQAYLAQGITSVHEAGIGGGWIGHSGSELGAYLTARDSGRLRTRVTLMPVSDVYHPVEGYAERDAVGLDLGIRTGFGDEMLRLGPMKIFTDGSLIGHTCAMHEGFADEPDNVGYYQGEADELTRRIVAAHRAGWQVASHAIGDRAIDLVLDAYETAARYPRTGPPHRIEHCAVTSPAQVDRIVSAGVVPVPQGSLVRHVGDGMVRSLGERSDWCYRVASFVRRGVPVPTSTDRPVVDGAPFATIHALLTRRTVTGTVVAPDEAVTLEEALMGATTWAARAVGIDREVGQVVPGQLADLTVLDASLEQTVRDDVDALLSVGVEMTVLAGEIAYRAPGAQR